MPILGAAIFVLMPLSRDTRFLAQLAMRQRGDRTLNRLIVAADAGLRTSVTLFLDSGHLVAGELISPKDWAAHVDRMLIDGVTAAEETAEREGRDDSVSTWRTVRETLEADRLEDAIQKHLDEEDALQKRLEDAPHDSRGLLDMEKLSDEDALQTIEFSSTRAVLALTNATVTSPTGGTTTISGDSMIRVFTSHISAWLVGRPRESDDG